MKNITRFSLSREKVAIWYDEYCPDEPEYSHDFIGIAYIPDGNGIHFLNGEPIRVERGTILIMDSSCLQRYVNINSLKHYNLCFAPDFFHKELKREDGLKNLFRCVGFDFENGYMVIKFPPEELEKITELFSSLVVESTERETGYLNVIHGQLEKLLVLIGRNYVENSKKERVYGDTFLKALEYISDHCTERLMLKDVADKFGYEPNYFSVMIKKQCGYGFKRLVIKKRLCKVLFLLWDSDESVDEIISKCGFKQKSFFYEAFEKEYGVKPKKWRESKRGKKHNTIKKN